MSSVLENTRKIARDAAVSLWNRRVLVVAHPAIASGIGVGMIVLLIFLNALRHSKSGELAGALGSVVGGITGAGGAVWAVYLALSRQRRDEMAKVRSAVRTEVISFVKHVIGTIDMCIFVATGEIKIPRQEATTISKSLPSDPVIYPAVADRVGLLPHPEATVGFYMRIAEAKASLELLASKPTPVSETMYVTPPPEFVTAENILPIVDALTTALQLAYSVIAEGRTVEERRWLEAAIPRATLEQITECLKRAQNAFPAAESFGTPAAS